MDKIKNSGPCSPYLQRPLRSLDQAIKDQADSLRPHTQHPMARFGLSSPMAVPQKKTAA